MRLSLLLATFTLISSISAHATICGSYDNRERSNLQPVARLRTFSGGGGCTGTLISKTCMITAGHCVEGSLDVAEFNVPTSAPNGRAIAPSRADIYRVDKRSIVHRLNRQEDWAVFQLRVDDHLSPYLPGDYYGYRRVSFITPLPGSTIRITGYGVDRVDRMMSQVQRTHWGSVKNTTAWPPYLRYNADTMGGNSGSAIILESTGEVVGIHTNGGCGGGATSANRGVSISMAPDLKKAIAQCIRRERMQLGQF